RVSNIRPQCRSAATCRPAEEERSREEEQDEPACFLIGPQGHRVKTRGRRGIRGNSAKKNKSKTTRTFRRATHFLGRAWTSWVERTSVPRVFSRWPCTGRRISSSPHAISSVIPQQQRGYDAPAFADEHVVRAAGGSRVHHFATDAAREHCREQLRRREA